MVVSFRDNTYVADFYVNGKRIRKVIKGARGIREAKHTVQTNARSLYRSGYLRASGTCCSASQYSISCGSCKPVSGVAGAGREAQ